MGAIYRFELKTGLKQLLIWSLSVGFMGLLCIMVYHSMENSIAEMAESYSEMGAFSAAFGMDQLSIATFKGYFATEIGTIHSLGSAMFAAALATVILSKEEDGHTAEFIFTFPVSRGKIVAMKYLAVLTELVLFTGICFVLYELGFLYVDAEKMGTEYIVFMLAQLMMNVEIASICFVISALSHKNKVGAGIALAMLLYFFDLIARVIPDMKNAIMLTPMAYSNATDIFVKSGDRLPALLLGIAVTAVCLIGSGMVYVKRDLAS